MSKLAVVALGGNALLRSGQKCSYHQQIENVASAVESLLKLIDLGYNLVIGHGNGPQVGYVLLQHEAANRLYEMEGMPMDFCVAETQGSIGYLIEMGLRNALSQHQIQRNVLSLITQVLVDKNDPMFENPTKPIGPYYSEQEVAELLLDTPDAKYKEDPKGNGWQYRHHGGRRRHPRHQGKRYAQRCRGCDRQRLGFGADGRRHSGR